jgi:hypothetical protein
MADMLQNLQQPQRPQFNWLSGRPEFQEQTPILNQGQQGVQNQALQQLMNLLKGTGGLEGFKPIEDQARAQFNTQTIPGLAERFTSMGGGQRSSAFQGALGSAGSGLEQGLASLKSQYGLGQQGLLSQMGFQPSFENHLFQRQPGVPETFFNSLGGALGALIPFLPALFGAPSIPGLYGNKQQPTSQGSGPMNTNSSPTNLMNSYGVQPLNFGRGY